MNRRSSIKIRFYRGDHSGDTGQQIRKAFTEKLDHFLTHRIWGLPLFLGIMALVFLLTFTVGDWLKGYFEIFLESFSAAVTSGLTSLHVGDMMISLVVDGIISGVGGILTFLPNIFILFLALAFLEDSGYMARVAFVMDDIMGHLGLSGRAFIPASARIWMFCSCRHGLPCAGTPQGPVKNYFDHTVYVVQCKTSNPMYCFRRCSFQNMQCLYLTLCICSESSLRSLLLLSYPN